MSLLKRLNPRLAVLLVVLAGVIVGTVIASKHGSEAVSTAPSAPEGRAVKYAPRDPFDYSGFTILSRTVPKWPETASLEDVRECWRDLPKRMIERHDREIERAGPRVEARIKAMIWKAAMLNADNEPRRAYAVLRDVRDLVESDDAVAGRGLYTVVYFQGVTALRCGETENCIECRGESSCIIPIAKSAVHVNRSGSEQAIRHFEEYLRQFPDDLQVKWLLNLAHMTIATHPEGVAPEHRLSLDRFGNSEFDIGRFRDIGHLAGINRLNQAGGSLLDDFDGDGRLDFVCTTWDATESMRFFRNRGDGTFEDRSAAAGLTGQYGGLNLVQGDYDNDGRPDIFICRGAWLTVPTRPSLLRNNGDGTFTDATDRAGVREAVNSNCAAWADYDNDGHLDLFVCSETRENRLYRNRGDGTFEEVAKRAGLATQTMCKGATWLDFDNDGHPDLFINNLVGPTQLYRNNRDGTFAEVSGAMGINGPKDGFSCWSFDYDNDGWTDIFATCYDRDVASIVKGLIGQDHAKETNRLYRNRQGRGFDDVTREAGLTAVFATMGCNFADFDNDGYLDFYLGTGDPNLSTLVPNRMFKNVAGKRFAEITGSSGTGHLQKGHGVACGDWDRDGNIDLFLELGGAVAGDKYHNVLFQNPGQGNRSVTVKLVGVKSNRSAIGARIKAVTAGPNPRTVHRTVNSGGSFGANPLEQTLGLGRAEGLATLEIEWPTSGTKQVFRDIAAGQMVTIEEFAKEYKASPRQRIPLPK